MPLTNEERGQLEKSIDIEISRLKRTVDFARVAMKNKEWGVQNDSDFVLGWSLGSIISDFSHNISYTRQVNPPQEDINEGVDIISKRVREIKEAIFKCG
ncbi:MAG: hypothetical protein IIA82_05730 [Thaumarchaeota archaeon]|nr:hypothetical protein [Nitrososphaerota archaeon]